MSTVVANILSSTNDAKCYLMDNILGSGKAWITVDIISSVVTMNTSFNMSSAQDLGVGLYKGLLSISLPGSNGSRAVGMGYAASTDLQSFRYKGGLYDNTGGSTGIRLSTDYEITNTFAQGVIY
jgi:hypothetical protein